LWFRLFHPVQSVKGTKNAPEISDGTRYPRPTNKFADVIKGAVAGGYSFEGIVAGSSAG